MEMQIITLALLAFLSAVSAVYVEELREECPMKYKRYSANHTLCLGECCKCTWYKKGLSQYLKNHIVFLHNSFRSRIASGHSFGVSHLSRATNMLEMVWDDELAEMAQKWAGTCPILNGDCKLCRTIDRFPVGQIVLEYDLKTRQMSDKDLDMDFESFYIRLDSLNKKMLSSYKESDEKGLYTQILWAKTWRIGCGLLYYIGSDGRDHSTLVCNYGPTGNIEGEEVYKPGTVCSECPGNTCCGDNCKKHGVEAKYKGLCKLIDPTYPPEGFVPHQKVGKEIFYCNFNKESDCNYTVEGVDPWKVIKTGGGTFLHGFLQSDQTSFLHFTTPIKSKTGDVCIKVLTRKGPVEIGGDYDHLMYATIEKKDKYERGIGFPRVDKKTMHMYQYDYLQPEGYPKDTDGIKLTLSFSVLEHTPTQYFDILEIIAEDKKCPHVTTSEAFAFDVE